MSPRGALNETTILKLIEELKLQNWTLSINTDGSRWRAEPPERGRKTILFSARPADLTLVIRDLRDQGFRWPPGDPKAEPVLRSTPFAPKPHPGSFVEGAQPSDRPRGALQIVALNEDQAFERLKEARGYVELARQEHEDKQRVVDGIQETLGRAERERAAAEKVLREALGEMDEAKKTFDRMFSAKG